MSHIININKPKLSKEQLREIIINLRDVLSDLQYDTFQCVSCGYVLYEGDEELRCECSNGICSECKDELIPSCECSPNEGDNRCSYCLEVMSKVKYYCYQCNEFDKSPEI